MTPRDTARAWLDDPLGVVLDFETTALDGYAVEVGIVNMTGEALLHARLKPLAPMDPRAEAVHGITLDALGECPTFAQMQGRLLASEDRRRELETGIDVIQKTLRDRKSVV